MVFPKFQAAVFVHGCFWHGHDCSLFKLPGTRREFWSDKIDRNRKRDAVVQQLLTDAGWRSMTVWECAIRGPGKLGLPETVSRVAAWLSAGQQTAEVRGTT
jgi:DNA mismatch endonuclease, patch repair protein